MTRHESGNTPSTTRLCDTGRTLKPEGRLREQGFTLPEVLVSAFVLVIGLIFIAQFFSSAVGRVLDSDTRSLLHQVASEEIESIRALPYEDVGTVGGQPAGVLLPSEQRTVNSIDLDITREVIYIQDDSYSGPYPANYRRVTVRVGVHGDSRLAPVELTSNIAGGADGGTLDITVTDIQGNPVADARIVVTNTHLVPNVNIDSSAIRTDSQGHLLIPGLTPDATPAYVVTASKSGYNSDWTEPAVVVQDGLPYTVVQLIIDRLSTLLIHVVDGDGAAVAGVSLSVTGPRSYNETVQTDGTGTVTLADIGYSTSLDPYVIYLEEGQGYEPSSAEVVLDPGQNQEVTLTAVTLSTTTTTVGGSTTTTTLAGSTTTTTTAPVLGSLTVRVLKPNGDPLRNAEVNLNGVKKNSNSEGYVTFTDLSFGDYPMEIKRRNYRDYQTTVTIDGSVLLTVTMERD
ncbi:MAG: carboxypeptidase regulatory-like domain-containing protein [Thermoleophilia bacterium]|nr:carboxypeptidase regulatory-like domain-containing protein [Thermoleophilia bacterium]